MEVGPKVSFIRKPVVAAQLWRFQSGFFGLIATSSSGLLAFSRSRSRFSSKSSDDNQWVR
jgi:hypothetical protein